MRPRRPSAARQPAHSPRQRRRAPAGRDQCVPLPAQLHPRNAPLVLQDAHRADTSLRSLQRCARPGVDDVAKLTASTTPRDPQTDRRASAGVIRGARQRRLLCAAPAQAARLVLSRTLEGSSRGDRPRGARRHRRRPGALLIFSAEGSARSMRARGSGLSAGRSGLPLTCQAVRRLRLASPCTPPKSPGWNSRIATRASASAVGSEAFEMDDRQERGSRLPLPDESNGLGRAARLAAHCSLGRRPAVVTRGRRHRDARDCASRRGIAALSRVPLLCQEIDVCGVVPGTGWGGCSSRQTSRVR
jgi:hypothetical protein